MIQQWSSEEIKELLQYVQHLRDENDNYKSMIIASDAMIRNKDAQIKQLKLQLYAATTIRNTTELE